MKKMKKTTLAILLLAVALLLWGCSNGEIGFVSVMKYDNADRYTTGAAELSGSIRVLDVKWIDGEVDIQYYDGDKIVLKESSGKTLEEKEQLHWWLDDGTLTIQYAASGYKTNKFLNKELTILLPEGTELMQLKLEVVSSDVQLADVQAEKIKINTVSGDLEGHIATADQVTIETVSGEVDIEVNQTNSLTANTVSGNIKLLFAVAPEKIDAESVSGNVKICIPEDCGFRIVMNSVSGDADCELPAHKEGKNTYTSGNEACRININTVSGNAVLETLVK